MGHARISTTAIYADASGPEEQCLAAKFWETATQDGHPSEACPASGRQRFSLRRRNKRRDGLMKRATCSVALVLFLIAGAAAGLLGLVQLAAHL